MENKNIKSMTFGATIVFATILVIAIGMSVGKVSEQRLDDMEQQAEPNVIFSKKELKLGDTVTFGTYNDEPITWKVIHFFGRWQQGCTDYGKHYYHEGV